jgi:hypothetical protein
MRSTVKIALGTFACKGVETQLGSDLAAAVRAALADYTRMLKSGVKPVGVPKLFRDSAQPEPALTLDLPVDPETRTTLEREAARQGTTVSRLATHSVLVYLAEIDRLTPLNAA